jgi:hypothetical protein
MAFENKTGLNVYSQYGKRNTGGSVGSETTDGSTRVYSIDFTGESLNSGFFPKVVLPKGARITNAILRVDQAFVVSTGGTVAFGNAAGPVANGIVISEAELEAVGTNYITDTGSGTWDMTASTGLAADSAIGKSVSGTVDATAGRATLLLTFVQKAV